MGAESAHLFRALLLNFFLDKHNHRLPPYWVIQHAIDEKLLEEYCACLEEMLSAHMAALSVGEEC